jgi:hypothetical protein
VCNAAVKRYGVVLPRETRGSFDAVAREARDKIERDDIF